MASWSRYKKHRPARRAGPLALSAAAALVASLLVAPAAHAATVSTLDSNNQNCHSWLFGIAHQVHQANYYDYQGNWEIAYRSDGAGYELASRSSELDKCGSLPEPQRSSWADARSTVQTSLGYGNGGGQFTAAQSNISLSLGSRYSVDKYGIQRDNYTEALRYQNDALVALRPWTGRPRTVTASTSVERFGLGLSQVHDVLVSHGSGSYGWMTYAGSTDRTESLTLEFYSSTKSQLELWPRSDTARGFGFPRALTLSVQTSSGGWQPIASASNLTMPSSGPYTLSFPPTTGSIFKIDFTSLYHNYGNGIDSYMTTLNEVRLH